MAILRRHECAACGSKVTANFDHVGDCEGNCRGTFDHPRGVCRHAGQDITHDHVRTTTISDPDIVRRA